MAHGSSWGNTSSNLFQIVVLLLIVACVVLLVVVKSTSKEGEGNETTEWKHDPVKEAMVKELREMFEYHVPDTPEEKSLENATGIIPIEEEREPKKNVPLERLLELADQMERHVDQLADRTTRVEQAVGSFAYEGRIHFVLLLRPYEIHAHRLMKRKGEQLFVSFLDSQGERIAPVSAPEQIETKSLRVAVVNEVPAGWVAYGELPIEQKTSEEVSRPAVGWIFSGQLHARLKQLQRSLRDPDRNLIDPFALDTDVGAVVTGADRSERALLPAGEAQGD